MSRNTSLVSKVTLHTSKASQTFIQDVPVKVEQHDGYTELKFDGWERAVTVLMTGAERIALIELLGGTP